MKILKILILLFILAGISLVGDMLNEKGPSDNLTVTDSEFSLNSQQKSKVRTNYKFDVEYIESIHTLTVDEIIIWENIDSVQVDSLFLNLPKSSELNKDDMTKATYRINTFEINSVGAEFEYVPFENRNFIDSSLIVVNIPNGLKCNEVLEVKVQFNIILPKESKWRDAQFYNFENWYVSVSPLLDGKFSHFPTHNYIETFLEYSNFDFTISYPEEYNVALPGELKSKTNNRIISYTSSLKNVSRFNWFLFNGLTKLSEKTNIQGKEISLDIYVQDGKDNYIDRYVDGVQKYLETLSTIGSYPFSRLTIVDIPNNGQIENKSYPNLIALKTDLISPTKTQKFEYPLAQLIAEQYFGNLINSNNIKEAWLSKGLSSYIAEKLVRKHYGEFYAHFNIADFYPVYGLHFMSFAGIPLIYIVSDQEIPEGGRYLNEYYNNLAFADLSIPSNNFPTIESYQIASVVKPQLALQTFENLIGEEKFSSNLDEYARSFIYQYPTSGDFRKIMTSNCSQDNMVSYDELFGSDKTFDYSISSVGKRREDEYEIMVERVGSGVIPIVLNVITETDTIKLKWDGKDRFKIFTITTNAEVISAELDPENKNLLDLNFANNSYVVKEKYWGSISYATRVFFWFQNALMLIGGKG